MDTAIFTVMIVFAVGWGLIDLVRRDVRNMPKWAWALVISFFFVPFGVLLYIVLELTPLGETEEPSRGDSA